MRKIKDDIMYKYLGKKDSLEQIKKLNTDELEILCNEIRDKLINTVSQNGGHLASNLGVVELTIALHRVLQAPKDKIIWDVGHQSYVHKMLTDRFEKMDSIRQKDGISGFCNPKESEYDASFSGHASTSLSTALGFCQARKITGETYEIAAVIGDGAFTGGLAFEALNNIGNLKSKMLIILNDNEMSISENVGALSKLLMKARTNRKYTSSKRKIVQKIKKMPGGGHRLMGALRKIKSSIKSALGQNMLFEQLGITYLGPVNGHDIHAMEVLFRRALSLDEPVIVHVKTKKGKGYVPAENSPQTFHGVGPFEVETGEQEKKRASYSDVFGKVMCSMAEKNDKLAVITPAMVPGSGLKEFASTYPEKIFDVGIAEGHAVTFAGGMAAGGAMPVVSIYSSFLQRGYDNLIHDVAIGKYHVVFAVDRAGIVAGDGATHQGVFDISYLTAVPNMTLLSPSSYDELEKMLCYAVDKHDAPIAIRYPRGREARSIDNGEFVLSKASVVKEGCDITILAEGQSVATALAAADILSEKGISAEVIDARTIKPLDFETVFESAAKTGKLYTIEENLRRGGMGEMISAEAKVRGLTFDLVIKAIEDEFITHGTIADLNDFYGFTPEKIARDAERMLKD